MKRLVCVVLLLFASASLAVQAGKMEKALKGRWLGAWVVLQTESFSDCGGMYTNNRMNGRLAKSRGLYAFSPGELAKIDKMDIKRSRIDLHLSIDEPMRVSYQEGPFTLYNHSACRIEMEIVLPRHAVKQKDDSYVEQTLVDLFERYATRGQAEGSGSWNMREVEPFPDDYDRTLAELAVWRAEQTNLTVQARIDQATDETARVADRLSSDPVYLAAFAEGVEQAKASGISDSCPSLLAVNLERFRATPRPNTSADARATRGRADGKLLYYGLEMLRGLPGCFVPVPDPPELRAAN